MSLGTATILHYAILAAGVITWLFAFYVHKRAFRLVDPTQPTLMRSGQVDVQASLQEVRDKTVESLRSGALGGTGTVLLTEATDRHIAGEVQMLTPKKGAGGGKAFFSVDLREMGGGTQAEYRLDGKGRSLLGLVSAFFVYILCPAVMIAAHLLVKRYVLESDNPKHYEAALQTVQIVHFLWPPFLFAYLRRHLAGSAETALTNVLRNTAF